MSSSTTTSTSTTNIHTGDPSTSSTRKGSSLLDDPAFSSTAPTVAANTKQEATSSSTMSPPSPAPPMGHDHSTEKTPKRRKSSASSHSRSPGHTTSSAVVPSIPVPAPSQPTHHRSSSVSQHLPVHRRTPSSSSQSGRSPSPGSTAFVTPPGVSISQITPNIFVGNNASSTSIPTLMHYGITSMVSLLSTSEQALNEEAWNSPALEMLVPKQNRLFVRCEDSPEEDLVGRLGMICDFIDEQVEGVPGSGPRRRKKSVEDVLESVLPASEVPKGFNAAGHEPARPKQRVRSLIPDDDGNFEGPPSTTAQPAPSEGAEDLPDLTRKKSAGPAPQKQRVRSLIPDDVDLARGGPAPVPSVPSGSMSFVPSAPVPSLPDGQPSSTSHLSPDSGSASRTGSTASQLSALSPSAQAGPSASPATSPSRSPQSPSSPLVPETQGGKVLIHCNQGVSRSGAACVAYIMRQNPKWSADKALRFVQVKRKEVEPSENFLGQLEVWKECNYEVWEDGSLRPGEGLEVEGKSIDGKTRGSKGKGKAKGEKVPKKPYEKWLGKREELIKRVAEMGGLVSPAPED